MALEFAEVGQKRGKVTVSISKKTRLISFSSGFYKKYLGNRRPDYLRQGYDKEENKIGIQFCEEDDDSGQLLKLSYTETKNAASCGVTPIMNKFGLEIEDVDGTYSEGAISKKSGSITIISGTYSDVFLLDIDKRKK